MCQGDIIPPPSPFHPTHFLVVCNRKRNNKLLFQIYITQMSMKRFGDGGWQATRKRSHKRIYFAQKRRPFNVLLLSVCPTSHHTQFPLIHSIYDVRSVGLCLSMLCYAVRIPLFMLDIGMRDACVVFTAPTKYLSVKRQVCLSHFSLTLSIHLHTQHNKNGLLRLACSYLARVRAAYSSRCRFSYNYLL